MIVPEVERCGYVLIPHSPDEAAILTMLAGVWRGIERAEMGNLRLESAEYGFDRVLRDLPLHKTPNRTIVAPRPRESAKSA
jgi:hypothetical protein